MPRPHHVIGVVWLFVEVAFLVFDTPASPVPARVRGRRMVERLLPAPLMFRSPHGMDAGKVSMLLPCVRAPAASRRQRLEKNATAPTTVQGGRQRQRVAAAAAAASF